MKKFILFIIVMLGFALNIDAQEKMSYMVTISVQVNYEYYDENGKKVGENSVLGVPQVIPVQARTPHEASKIALDECSTMCRQGKGIGNGKDEGKKMYNGKLCQCYSTKEPYEVVAVKQIK
ncbi:MAG: hypothetical protein J6J76_08205 [Paraprevotella sp.]|nr:hypothetical protein [Paraprevotella sp.]